jgi:membrane protein YqaA with SNARE-associated domain
MWASHTLREILSAYGYGAVALSAGLEGMGFPVPGEAMLVLASVYAGLTGHLSIVLVVAAAAGGAIAGDNIGYWIGRELGTRLLRRRRRRGMLSERRVRIGQYLFARHGAKIVFLAGIAAAALVSFRRRERAWAAEALRAAHEQDRSSNQGTRAACESESGSRPPPSATHS